MSETYSTPRQQAEIAFGKAQSQFLSRDRAHQELDAVAVARDEKTKRLREARLAKEEEARALAAETQAPRQKPRRKSIRLGA